MAKTTTVKAAVKDKPHRKLKEAEVVSTTWSSEDHKSTENPQLPSEISGFKTEQLDRQYPHPRLTADEWLGALHGAEIKDKLQQIRLRPLFALGVFLLIGIQNLGIWFIVVWALQSGSVAKLQPILGVLIAGTLTQSYYILRFITNRIFTDIDYHNNGKSDK